MHKHYRSYLLLITVGLLIAWSITSRRSYLLKTPAAPMGTISWQLTFDKATQQQILKEWRTGKEKQRVYSRDTSYVKTYTALETAKEQNRKDPVLILFYTLLLLALIFRINYWRQQASMATMGDRSLRILASTVFTAALANLLEDLAAGRALNEGSLNPLYIALFASLKWLLLLAVVLCLMRELILTGKVVQALKECSGYLWKGAVFAWRFRTVLIVLLLLFLLLFVSDQGQDLLVTINTSRLACACFLTATVILALLCWHLPKLVDHARQVPLNRSFAAALDINRQRSSLDTGRLLGAAAFLLPAAGILQTMNNYHIGHWFTGIPPLGIFLALLLLYAQVLRNRWIERIYYPRNRFRKKALMLTVLLTIAIIAGLGFLESNRQPFFLIFLFADLLLLSLIFLVLATLRTRIPVIRDWNITPWIMTAGLLSLLFFILCNYPPFLRSLTLHGRFFTMPVVLIGVSGYLLLFSWMLYFGKRTNIKLLTMLLLIGIYVASTRITDYHNMTVVPKKTGQKEDSLSSYARNWILRRKAAVARLAAEGQQYPVFFVNTYGGGIRATVWTTMIVGTIDSLLKRKAIPDYLSNEFQDYIFSYSGASGGTIGAALLTAERSARLLNNSRPSLLWPGASITAVYQKDYLSADIVSLLGRDFIAGSFGLSIWDDRARLMEQDWETANPNQIPLAHSLSALWENSGYRLPLFFSNTYDIDNGYKGIAAPVKLAAADFPSVVILRSGLAPHEDIPMSTAAFVSARFPYVSPTGKLKGKHHFTDGGTYDNSGTETSLQVYQVFARELKKLAQEDTVFTHIRPQFLSLSNSVETGDSLARARNLYEPVAPLIGILAMTAGVKDRSVQQLRLVQSREGIGYFQFSPRIIKLKNNQSWPVLPLGWQISDDALLLMKLNVLDSQTGLQRILQLFPSVTRQQRPSLH